MRLIEKIAQVVKIPGMAQKAKSDIWGVKKGKEQYSHTKLQRSKMAISTAVS